MRGMCEVAIDANGGQRHLDVVSGEVGIVDVEHLEVASVRARDACTTQLHAAANAT